MTSQNQIGLGPASRRRAWLFWIGAAVIAAALALSVIVWVRSLKNSLSPFPPNATTVSQSLVVDKVEKVAKLVSSEVTLRDVVVYEDTWYGSTKRSLVVVTGKVLAGIDLQKGTTARIDDAGKRITITLPQPTVLGIEITELKTYDEQRGLWNTFAPSDRDRIFQLARDQLAKSSQELRITQTAEQSARELLSSLFADGGYTVDVTFE